MSTATITHPLLRDKYLAEVRFTTQVHKQLIVDTGILAKDPSHKVDLKRKITKIRHQFLDLQQLYYKAEGL